MIRRIAASALALCLIAGFAAGGVPQLLNYQGKLADNLGKPVDASKQMVFEFYDAAAAGNLLEGFSETQQVIVAKGIFNVLIGSATAGGVPASVFDHASVYLSVKVQGQELSPRQRLVSVAYAFRSAQADDAGALQGRASSDFALKTDLPDVTAMQAALADLQARLSAVEVTHWTLTIEPSQGNGGTYPFAGSYIYHAGTAPGMVTAIAEPGWQFDHWEGTAVSGAPDNSSIIPSGTAGQTMTLKAVFITLTLAPMCAVPAGEFRTSTGSTVYLDAYSIDKYEVTNELYVTFLYAGGNDDHYHSEMSAEIAYIGTPEAHTYQIVNVAEQKPVRWVTYFDAIDFCDWRSAAENRPAGSYRLPTEAEWDKAAGWGDPARTSLWTYAFQSDSIDCNKAHYADCAGGHTREVGSYTASKSWYGCYDMTGNVLEWCSDWWGGTYPSSMSNPTGPTTGMYRVLRGGSWLIDAPRCRIAYRNYNTPSYVRYDYGFRCARTP